MCIHAFRRRMDGSAWGTNAYARPPHLLMTWWWNIYRMCDKTLLQTVTQNEMFGQEPWKIFENLFLFTFPAASIWIGCERVSDSRYSTSSIPNLSRRYLKTSGQSNGTKKRSLWAKSFQGSSHNVYLHSLNLKCDGMFSLKKEGNSCWARLCALKALNWFHLLVEKMIIHLNPVAKKVRERERDKKKVHESPSNTNHYQNMCRAAPWWTNNGLKKTLWYLLGIRTEVIGQQKPRND